jgi:hypothetical protein
MVVLQLFEAAELELIVIGKSTFTVGVPEPVRVMACVPTASVPLLVKRIPLVSGVLMLYEPATVVFTFNVIVWVVNAVPFTNAPFTATLEQFMVKVATAGTTVTVGVQVGSSVMPLKVRVLVPAAVGVPWAGIFTVIVPV